MRMKLGSWGLLVLVAGLSAIFFTFDTLPCAVAASAAAGYYGILSDIFLCLNKMVIVLLVFAKVALGMVPVLAQPDTVLKRSLIDLGLVTSLKTGGFNLKSFINHVSLCNGFGRRWSGLQNQIMVFR